MGEREELSLLNKGCHGESKFTTILRSHYLNSSRNCSCLGSLTFQSGFVLTPQHMGSNVYFFMYFYSLYHARIQRGNRGPNPLKDHKFIWFYSNTGPDPSENHKPTKPAFNVGHYWPTSEMPFQWHFAGRLIIARNSGFRSLAPLNKKPYQSWTPSDKTFWIRACFIDNL